MLNANRQNPPATPQARGFWPRLRARLNAAERAKRQLERSYQRRAAQRLRESGLSRA